jgi:methionyl-tRNA synthetase
MSNEKNTRPEFPKRAIVTGGMPYGEKLLHFGHVCGMYLHADIYARFLRDRLGSENVIFVSGTDCYGAGPEIKFEKEKENGFEGTLKDFITGNHLKQKQTLDTYGISLNLFAASALGEAGEIHAELSEEIFNTLYDNGYLKLSETLQFYDEDTRKFLNGRQVEGRCPIAGCKSEVAYADECALGHQYSPSELIAPKAVTTGKTPVLKSIKNWYFDLERFSGKLKKRQDFLREEGLSRKFMLSTIDDFLKDPQILIKTEDFETLREVCKEMPSHILEENAAGKSAVLTFKALKDREKACEVLRANNIRFRTGTTLVPFRISGNVAWGINVPEKEDVTGQTFWVWPESLWAPISFVKAYLKKTTGTADGWSDWWFNPDSRVYQFIGEDCIYFYAIAEMGLFMALNAAKGRDEEANLPTIVSNRHAFYGNKKVSSSGSVKPPSPEEILQHYTAEQLRMHFAHMAVHTNSVSFSPKAFLDSSGGGFDTVTAEGNILTNVYNRLIRSCFYTMQKYYNGKLPQGEVSPEYKDTADKLIYEYEWAMYRVEYAKVIDLFDVYLRDANKVWSANSKLADAEENEDLRRQTLIDAFHAVRVAATLLHPFAPLGTETVREYLNVDERIWSWEFINEPLNFFMEEEHTFKFLEPRVDFFVKHPSQLGNK